MEVRRKHGLKVQFCCHLSDSIQNCRYFLLAGSPLEVFPYHHDDRFPRSLLTPILGSRRLYAADHKRSRQVSCLFIEVLQPGTSFDLTVQLYDTSSAIHFRSSSKDCKPIPRGPQVSLLPSSIAKLRDHLHHFCELGALSWHTVENYVR